MNKEFRNKSIKLLILLIANILGVFFYPILYNSFYSSNIIIVGYILVIISLFANLVFTSVELISLYEKENKDASDR